MNAFKKKSLYLAMAAGLGAVGVAGSAAAVTLSQTGTGQVLIYPYFTARDGNATYVSVANTTASAKAVKVRFLEGKNSREVLDFNLYLSANDVWTGAVIATTDGAQLISRDTSCTGWEPAAGAVATKDFVNYAYGGADIERITGYVPDPSVDDTGDYEDKTLDRSREGYFEIIEMGTIVGGSALETAVTHTGTTSAARQPKDCSVPNGLTAVTAANMIEPTGGLIGTASIINVDAGTDSSFDPVALSAFVNTPGAVIWDIPGSIYPDLTKVTPKSSTVFKNGLPVTSAWNRGAIGSPADPVTAVLMHDRLMNDYVLDANTESGTDWVVTMPTKRHYIGVDGTPGTAGSIGGAGTVGLDATSAAYKPFTSRFYTGGACEPIHISYYDREELAPTGSSQPVSPLPPGVAGDALCWESTVLTFNDSNVLGSKNFVNKNVAYENGWAMIKFDNVNNVMLDNDGVTATYTYRGLPAVGFMVQDFVNNNAAPGIMATYSGGFIHKYRTNITSAVGAPTTITNVTGE